MYDIYKQILRVKTRGSKASRERLARIFCQTVLDYQLNADNDRIINDLNRMKDSDFEFLLNPEDNIVSIALTYADFAYRNRNKRISFSSSEEKDMNGCEYLIDWAKKCIGDDDWGSVDITHARIVFSLNDKVKLPHRARRKHTVYIWKINCNLSLRPEHAGIARCLENSGIFDSQNAILMEV